MKDFKFFNKENEFGGIVLSDDMLSTVYNLCEIEINHMRECEEKFLRDNPHIDRNGEYGVPTTYNHIDDVKLPEGIVSYFGTDFNEEYDNVMEHLLTFHPNGRGTNNYTMRFDDNIKQMVYCCYDIIVRQDQPSNKLTIFSVTISEE
jgi:hypothetical protein